MASGRGRRFAKGLIGYDIAEVDDFVERADQDLYWLQQEATRRRMQPGWAQYPPPGLLTPYELEQKDFAKVMRGYAMPEVDTFLAQVARDLGWMQEEAFLRQIQPQAARTPPPGLLQAADLEIKQFSKAVRGYNRPAVDSFLDRLSEEFRRLAQELGMARGRAYRRY